MGKSRKSKQSGGPRQNNQPTGLPSVEETLKVEGESVGGRGRGRGIPASINTCVDQLQSHEALEKECGLLTLAELSGQPEAEPVFRDLRLTRHVAPLVVDAEENVRVAAVGSLLAMANAGGGAEETIERMVNDDVMTPVIALMKKYFPKGWTPGKSSKELDVFVNAVSLLRSLCETSPTALQVFNREDVIASLLHATDVKVFNQPVVVAVCECLLTITESNPPAIQSLKENADAFRCLQHLVQTQPSAEIGHENSDAKTLLVSVLAAGILMNLSGDDLSSAPPALFSSILTLIPAVLNINVETSINDLKRLKPNGKSISKTKEGEEEEMEEEMNGHTNGGANSLNGGEEEANGEEEGEAEEDDDDAADEAAAGVIPKGHRSKLLERIGDILSAQQMALELLTNVCSAADDEWDDDDNDDISSTSSEGQIDLGASHENIALEEESCFVLPSEVHEALISSETISTITRCCGSSLFESRAGLEEYLDLAQARLVFRKLCLVQTRALTALHNLVSSEAACLGGVEDLVSLFTKLSSTLAAIASTEYTSWSIELLEATTSALRAVVTKVAAAEKSSFSFGMFAPSQSDVELLINIFKSMKGDSPEDCVNHRSVKINVVRISSLLAASKRVKREDPETFKTSGNFLLSAAVDGDVAVAAEALDAIFDVFGDDDDISESLREAEKEIRLVARLSDLIPGFQEKVRLQRKQLGPEQKAVVQTVKTNLSRFINYKSKGK